LDIAANLVAQARERAAAHQLDIEFREVDAEALPYADDEFDAAMRYPFPPAGTVDFFRRYYGPTGKAFDALGVAAQELLRRDLVELQAAHNTAPEPGTTEARAEYLEVLALRA